MDLNLQKEQFRQQFAVDALTGMMERLDDQPRKVVVELRDADYHKAVTAHDEARFVRCFRVLARDGRGFRLYEPYGFDVEDDDPQ